MTNDLEKVSIACHNLLNIFPSAEETKKYLDNRLSKEVQDKFTLGYMPHSELISILTRELSENLLINNRLFFAKNIKYDEENTFKHFTGHFDDNPLIIPYKDVYGEIVGLIGRSIDSKNLSKKYKYTFFKKSHHLFGLYEAKKSILENDLVFVVEGQFDAMKAHQVGMHNVVAVGNAYMSSYQMSLLSRYTKNIILLLDNDEAGVKGREYIQQKFDKHAKIINWYIPYMYKDLDEYISDINCYPKFSLESTR